MTAFVLMFAGAFAHLRADVQEAHAAYEQALRLFQELEFRPGIYTALNNLAEVVGWLEGDRQRARLLHEESLGLKRKQGDTSGIALSLFSLGQLAWWEGAYERAAELHRESLQLHWLLGDQRALALALERLAWVLAMRGEGEIAVEL